jgi:hypothetical protein
MKRIFTRISNYRLLLAAVVTLASSISFAQDRTFYESFDDTPEGEVPAGWITYTLGGAQGNNWVRGRYGFFGPKLMTSGVEYALPGQIDEDWLVTPQITPAANDYLIFDAGQEFTWDDLGSTFEIRISTETSSRADFSMVLASWTETEFPGYVYEEQLFVDLSSYEGQAIYIAFVHKNPVTGEGSEQPPPAENWYLDNVEIRPLKPMGYTGAEIQGSYRGVIRLVQSKTAVVIGFIVRTSGDNGEAVISSMKLTTTGTSPLIHIKNATVYTTYGDSFIATDDEEGIVWADVFGTVENPGDEFIIEGSQVLERGDTYFWLMYEIEADENDLIYPYPQADATFETVTINSVEHATDVPTTVGSHAVVPNSPPNDNYADAIEIAGTHDKVRYGSYNYKATYEADTDYEKLAYCATPIFGSAMDGSNSVWWHFHAPSDGFITVDLSLCDFNTMLLIQDENSDQLACNKDIDEQAFVFQSKITNFEVHEGKDYYIRVTGEGQYPGDPNAGNGVVHMDFTFGVPLGEEEEFEQRLSSLYPNPASGVVYADVFLKRPMNVTVEMIDLMGRVSYTENFGTLSSGQHNNLPVEISTLPAGTYLVRLRGVQSVNTEKLIVTKK